jgi:hypothetical protein
MTLPTSYTEATFGTYLEAVLGSEVMGILGISSITTGDEIIYSTLFDYGVSDIANATDLRKLRSLGKVNLWKTVMGKASARIKFSADGGSYDQQQLYEHCKSNYLAAIRDALEYDPTYEIQTETLDTKQQPYKYNEDRVDMRDYVNDW